MKFRSVNIAPTGIPETGAAETLQQPENDLKAKAAQPQDAFGNEEFAEVKYKTLTWWQGGLLLVAETISLGILSLPAAVANLGLVPAVIILIGLGILASYTGYVIGQYKIRHPHISSIADAGEVLMGRFGRELFTVANILFLVFIMASHLLTFTVALNTITHHATCSLVFGIVGMIISLILSLPRTLKKVSWLSIISFGSIFSAVLITMIAVGVQHKGTVVEATTKPSLVTGFTSAANIVFSFSTHNTFFTFIAELSDPSDFPKSLALLQTVDISIYVIAAVVIYRFAGPGVASPALGSAGVLISKIAYGIALPTIAIAGVIVGHVAAKLIYLRVFAHTDRMHKRDWIAIGSWVGICVALWVIAWVIASAIPVFSNLLSLIVSLFASWFSFIFTGAFWFHMNRGRWFSSPTKILLSCVNLFSICVGLILCVLGLYTSGKAIHDDKSSASFSCADNSG